MTTKQIALDITKFKSIFSMDLKSTYNKIASDWHQDHKNDAKWAKILDQLVGLLPQDAEILDLGCGPGLEAKYLTNKGFKVLGIDFSEKMIKIARQNVPGVNFKVLDIRDVKTLDKTFDAIIAQAVLLHFTKKEIPKILSDIKSKLKPNGFLMVGLKNVNKDGVGKKEEIITENDYGYDYQRFFSFFKMPEIKKHLTDSGFKIVYGYTSRDGWIYVIGQK